MGAPRAKASPNSHSIGITTRLITILSITPGQSPVAICADRGGYEVRVPLLSHRAKGLLPKTGENWIVGRDVSQQDGWTFLTFIGSDPSDFQAGAGDIKSGALDGTVMTGNIQLGYSGTPAAGSLTMSAAPAAGTDAYGNSFLPGYTTYWQAGGAAYALAAWNGRQALYSAASQAGPWTALPLSVMKPASTSRGSSSIAADPHLVINGLQPGTEYRVELDALVTGGGPGIQYNFSVPSGSAGTYGSVQYTAVSTPVFQSFVSANWTTTNQAGIPSSLPLKISGTLVTGSTIGSITFNWAQNSSGSPDTVIGEYSLLKVTLVG